VRTPRTDALTSEEKEMKGVYRVFAYLIALEVIVQAAAIALAVFGLGKWIDDGGTLNKAVMEGNDSSIDGVIGFAIHGINGTMIIPILTLLFLIISFFAKVPGGVKWAAITFGLMVLQVALGIFSHAVYPLGPLHAINAFILMGVAATAGRRVSTVTATAPVATEAAATV
jgi:hypothetical protein